MKTPLLTLLLIFQVCSSAFGFPEGTWSSRGYRIKLTGEMSPGRCEHFLSFISPDKLVWLEMEELIHSETGDIILPTSRDTVTLVSSGSNSGTYFFDLADREYTLFTSGETIRLMTEKYFIEFEKIRAIPEEGINSEKILSVLINHAFEEKSENSYNVVGSYFVNDSIHLVQHDFGEPFEAKWRLVELGGFFFIDGQVDAPMLVTKIEGDTILGLKLDYRYNPFQFMYRPTTIFFQE